MIKKQDFNKFGMSIQNLIFQLGLIPYINEFTLSLVPSMDRGLIVPFLVIWSNSSFKSFFQNVDYPKWRHTFGSVLDFK